MKIIVTLLTVCLLSAQIEFKNDFEKNVFESWKKAQGKSDVLFESELDCDFQTDQNNLLKRTMFENKTFLIRRMLPDEDQIEPHLAFLGGRLLYVLETFNKRLIELILTSNGMKTISGLLLDQFISSKAKFTSMSIEETNLEYQLKFIFDNINLEFRTTSKQLPSAERFYLPLEEKRFTRKLFSQPNHNQITTKSQPRDDLQSI